MTDADEIRSLIAANALAANDAAANPTVAAAHAWVATFADDAAFHLGELVIRSRPQLLAFHARMMGSGMPFPEHFVGASKIEVWGDRAFGLTDFLVIAQAPQWQIAGFGRYHDHYSKTAGIWRIQERRAEMIGGTPKHVASVAREFTLPSKE